MSRALWLRSTSRTLALGAAAARCRSVDELADAATVWLRQLDSTIIRVGQLGYSHLGLI